MEPLSEKQLKSLVGLLDDEDLKSLELVRRHILRVGEPAVPFLKDLERRGPATLAGRVQELLAEIGFKPLKLSFQRWASSEMDLEEGIWLLARFAYPQIDPGIYKLWLDRVAWDVRGVLPHGAGGYAVMQQLNTHLFQELGFSGNNESYYEPDNVYLNRVIDRRRGIPVSLSALYLLIGRRLNLPVYGVGAPGHFLVGFKTEPEPAFFLDPFHRGRLLAQQDVRRMMERNGYEFHPQFLKPATSREIILRMMRNLISIYQKSGAPDPADRLSILAEILITTPRISP